MGRLTLHEEVDALFAEAVRLPKGVAPMAVDPAMQSAAPAVLTERLVERLPNVKTLVVPDGTPSEGVLRALRGHATLEAVQLRLTEAPEEGLAETLASMPRLREVAVRIAGTPSLEAVRTIAALPHLTRVTVEGGLQWGRGVIGALERATALHTLRLWQMDAVLTEDTDRLTRFPKLSVLVLARQDTVPSELFQSLASIETLTYLAVEGVKSLRDSAYAPLAEMGGLRGLSLRGCSASGKVAPYVAALTGLRSLNLGWSNVEGKALASLSSLTLLEELDLSNTKVSAPVLKAWLSPRSMRTVRAYKVAPAPLLSALSVNPTLAQLRFSGTKLGKANVRALRAFPQLRALDVDSTEGEAAVFYGLSHLMGLESLSAGHVALNTHALGAIGSLAMLRSLSLPYVSGVEARDFATLQYARSLERLSLQGAPVTLAEMEAIVRGTALREVVLWGCPAIDDAAVARLQALRPTLVVDRA